MVVGTGHASSYLFAHQALAEGWTAQHFSAAADRYGQPGGDPSELPPPHGAPYQGGELGAALAVTQGLSAFSDHRLTVCIVGDGECETPSALAAFVHGDVLLGCGAGRRAWLPVINANGARMGGPSVWDGTRLERFLTGLDYEVIRSGEDPQEASDAADLALRRCLSNDKVVWISETEKGWPAPPSIGDVPFRGHRAHRPPRIDPGLVERDLMRWFEEFGGKNILSEGNQNVSTARQLVKRVTFSLEANRSSSSESSWLLPHGAANKSWQSPIGLVDKLLAHRDTLVFCPDEADSNRLHTCLASGRLIEVLSEVTCLAWTWGAVEASREAVFATYEAFAPLTSSMLAQYAKLCDSDRQRDHPPLIVLQTSLGWANTPSHQNTDLAATFLVRPRARLVCPIGATSAIRRTHELFRARNTIGLLVVSKQALLDLPDPGGSSAVELRVSDGNVPRATIVAVGDICVTEAVAVMVAGVEIGLAIRVVAIVEPRSVSDYGTESSYSSENMAGDGPYVVTVPPADSTAIGVSWCASRFIATAMWDTFGSSFPIYGFVERFGSTPWETLKANSQDRLSLAAALVGGGLAPGRLVDAVECQIADVHDPSHAGSVPQFNCPLLSAAPWKPAQFDVVV